MSGINVREQCGGGKLVELSGEFDLHDLDAVSHALGAIPGEDPAFGRPAVVDLSGVTFLDIGVTRELAVRSQLAARHMTLLSPSPAVLASVAACGLGDWFDFDNTASAAASNP